MLTTKDLDGFEPHTIFAQGFGFIEHPYFNDAKKTLGRDGRSTKVKWVATVGGVGDWKIYHSLDANLEKADYLDGTDHLSASYEQVYRSGASLYDRKTIRKLMPCTDEALKRYRN